MIAAGLDGRGNSSYIDGMILRDKDANTGWTSASDGTLEQRYYYCQNWRADVVALVTAGGYEVEWVKGTARLSRQSSGCSLVMVQPPAETNADRIARYYIMGINVLIPLSYSQRHDPLALQRFSTEHDKYIY